MKRSNLVFITVLLGISTITHAQLTHIFTKTAHTTTNGNATDLAVAADGTVFVANGFDGLRAYRYDGTSFTNVGHINDRGIGGNAENVGIAADGTIFLANGGFWLYTYDGTTFTNIGHIDEENAYERGMAFASDGTVFLSHGVFVRSYRFDGNSLTTVAQFDPGVWPWDIAIGADSTIFLAGRGSVISRGGFEALSYDGTTFTNTTLIDNGTSNYGVAVGADGTVFFVGHTRPDSTGLWAYTYDGTTITNTAYVEIAGQGDDIVAEDGTIFLANGFDGLRAYSYNGTSLTNTAHINDGGEAEGLAIAADGTVFLANRDEGLFAYKYSMVTGIADEPSQIPSSFALEQNYPNPFNPDTEIRFQLPKTSYVQIGIFDLMGIEVRTLVDDQYASGSHSINWDGKDYQGKPVPSGLFLYRIHAGEFMQVKKMTLLR